MEGPNGGAQSPLPMFPVDVSYTDGRFEFNPDDLVVRSSMNSPVNVLLRRKPRTATWKFTDFQIGGPSGQFQHTISPAGAQVTVRDKFEHEGAFKYTVTIKETDSAPPIESPDPRIINTP